VLLAQHPTLRRSRASNGAARLRLRPNTYISSSGYLPPCRCSGCGCNRRRVRGVLGRTPTVSEIATAQRAPEATSSGHLHLLAHLRHAGALIAGQTHVAKLLMYVVTASPAHGRTVRG